jgi:hypothetical protein
MVSQGLLSSSSKLETSPYARAESGQDWAGSYQEKRGPDEDPLIVYFCLLFD